MILQSGRHFLHLGRQQERQYLGQAIRFILMIYLLLV